MSENIIEKVQAYNQPNCENLTIEITIQIDEKNRVICPGIGIDVEQTYAPIFISAHELRKMADESEAYAKKQLNGK